MFSVCLLVVLCGNHSSEEGVAAVYEFLGFFFFSVRFLVMLGPSQGFWVRERAGLYESTSRHLFGPPMLVVFYAEGRKGGYWDVLARVFPILHLF